MPNFVGNVEGFAVGTGEADVIVADGFTGNVFLKVMEGTSAALLGAVREAAISSPRSKLGGLLLRPALRGLRGQIDPEEQGGAVLLGFAPSGRGAARLVQRARVRARDRGRGPRCARGCGGKDTRTTRRGGRVAGGVRTDR